MPGDATSKKKRILVVGLGLQGWAIVRQLMKLRDEKPEYDVYIYDFNPKRESQLLPDHLLQEHGAFSEVQLAFQTGYIKKLRSVNPSAFEIIRVCQRDLLDDNAQALARKLFAQELTNLKLDLIINASTFTGHEFYTHLAFELDCDYIDLGQSTWQALKQRTLDQDIRESGHSLRIVPECGLAPGLVNILGAWLLKNGGDSVQIRVGGLPIDTRKGGNLHYGLSWSFDGLLKEYKDVTIARKNRRMVTFAGLTSREDQEDPSCMSQGILPFILNKGEMIQRLKNLMEDPHFFETVEGQGIIKNLEARPTSDGISLMPFDPDFAHLTDMEYKTLRYEGHFAEVEHRDKVGELTSIQLSPATPDLVLLRIWTEEQGTIQSLIEGVILCDPILDDQPEEQVASQFVFTAMQHLTGLPTALVARALLNYRDLVTDTRPDLFRKDHLLWSGVSLDTALQEGGVIMPYELVDGEQMLAQLDSDDLIVHREFHLVKK